MKKNKNRNRKNIIFWTGIIVGCLIPLIFIVVIATRQIRKIKDYDWSEIKEQLEEVQSTVPSQEDSVKEEDIEITEDKLVQALTYFCGESGSLDDATAFSYMKEAADLGNSDAQFFVGEMYLQGIGTAEDKNQAAAYLKEAAKNNNGNAFSIYAKLCFTGYQDVNDSYEKYQDFEKARELFMIAEQAGDADAAYALGVMYFYGMCVAPDYNIANAYFAKAVEGGCAEASFWKEKVQAYVTAEGVEIPGSSISMPNQRVYNDEQINTLIAKYVDEVKQNEKYDEFMQELDSMKDLGPEPSTFVVMYGKNDWLFYQNANDGNTYEDYLGNPEKYFSLEEKEKIRENLEKQKAAVEAQKEGAKFYVVIIPNKETIYSEYMPTYVQRNSERTRTDDLVEYLQKNTSVEIIYVKEPMLAEKDKHQLYYYTDTHCNMKGTYIAVAELMKKFDKTLVLNDNDFVSNSALYAGDLGVMLGRQQRYTIDTVYNLVSNKIPEEQKIEKNALLIGDSFGEFFNMEAENYFKNGFTHKFIGDYGFNYNTVMDATLNNEAVDVVIWECAERYIDRLK